MSKEYAVMGARLECTHGTAPSNLVILPNRTVTLTGKLKANISDCKPMVNVMPFGMCQSPTNPGVIAAAGAPVPCTPACSIWMGGKPDTLVQGMPALLTGDKAVCLPPFAGMIEVKDSGQGSAKEANPPLEFEAVWGEDENSQQSASTEDDTDADYHKYVQRKEKEGKEARSKEDWKKERDYWHSDSPMARGNNFNRKAVEEEWYEYHEVHLANGKRLDSYAPPPPPPGEIVSRKATNLDDIEESTYRKYLQEMNDKYPAGMTIRSDKYKKGKNKIDGQQLSGKQILEIPDSNLNSPNIDRHKTIAAEYGIELRFKGE